MASVSYDKKTKRRILQFVSVDGKRKSIRLGKISKRNAEAVKVKVEDLAASQITGHVPSDDTNLWLAKVSDDLLEKLAAVGLVEPSEKKTLRAFIDEYVKRRTDIKKSTRTVLSHTRRNLIGFFGADKPIRDITEGEADEWRIYLIEQGLGQNTVRRRCGIAKQYFTAAKKKMLILHNPFIGLISRVTGNSRRDYFITLEEARKVLDCCPDAEWRLIFALSRFGGLRCPSEHLALRWNDIDWDRDRITVNSPKTEHHLGGESRQIPIFPELLPYLREVFEAADPGSEYVITRYRRGTQNLRTTLNRIIRLAGLEPWPKLFQNLRSTRETELAEKYPLHVVCAWIGNSQCPPSHTWDKLMLASKVFFRV
jgi:integrase